MVGIRNIQPERALRKLLQNKYFTTNIGGIQEQHEYNHAYKKTL